MNCRGPLDFSVTVEGVVVVGCEVVGWSYGLGVGFFFWRLFLFGAGLCGGMNFWWSGWYGGCSL